MTEPLIPDSALDTHIGVLGRTGSGKTYTARGLVERLLEANRQVVVIDPTGAWWGLRSEYDIPIFGGQHCDIPITDQSGSTVAETILTNRTSAIVDLSLLAREGGHAAMRRFMAALIKRLKDRPDGAFWLVIDEADEFMPQTLPADMTRLFGDLKWLVRRGRVAGWRVMMITQRPQDIAKAVLTQIGTLVAHRLTAPQDRKAVKEWVDGNADDGQAKEVLGTLSTLGTGEAWVWAPDQDVLTRATMPENRSHDSGATPNADSGTIEQPRLRDIDLAPLRELLDAEAAERERPAVELEREIATDDFNDRQDREADAERIAALEKDLSGANSQVDELLSLQDERARIVTNAVAMLTEAFPDVPVLLTEKPVERDPPAITVTPAPKSKPEPVAGKSAGCVIIDDPHAPDKPLPTAALNMAETLDRIAPARVTWASLAGMCGYKPRGGNFNAARKGLRDSRRIVEDGKWLTSSAPPTKPLDRNEALDLWRGVLTSPAPDMISALDQHGGGLTRKALGEALGKAARGGHFNGGVSQLKNNGVVIETDGNLYLTDPLPGQGK